MPKKPANQPDDTVKTIVKRRRTGLPNDINNINVDPGDNARYVRHAMAAWNLPPIDISDPQQVSDRITEYFQYCADNDRKPQLIGMANWIGVDRTTVDTWKKGVYRKDTHYHIIQRAVSALEELWADYMLNGKVNPASGIFISKNWFGYKDVQDVVVTPNNPLDSLQPDEARNRYMNGIPDVAQDGTEE